MRSELCLASQQCNRCKRYTGSENNLFLVNSNTGKILISCKGTVLLREVISENTTSSLHLSEKAINHFCHNTKVFIILRHFSQLIVGSVATSPLALR